jgi:hypothetical protein
MKDNGVELALLNTLKHAIRPDHATTALSYVNDAIDSSAHRAMQYGQYDSAVHEQLKANPSSVDCDLRHLTESQKLAEERAESRAEFARKWERAELKQVIDEAKDLIARLTPPEHNPAEVLGTPTASQKTNDDAYWSAFADTHDDLSS